MTSTHDSTWPLLKRMARNYLHPHKARFVLAFVLMLVAAAATGSLAKLMEPIIDDVFQAKDQQALFWVSAGVLTAFVVRGVATYGHGLLINAIGQRVVADIQRQLFSHLVSADLAFFHSTSSGGLISRITNDAIVMRYAVAECLTGLGYSGFSLITLIGVMFYQDWILALVCFAVFPLTGYYIATRSQRNRKISRKNQEEMGAFSGFLSQAFQNIRHVKAYGMEAYEQKRAESLTDSLRHLAQKNYRVSQASGPVTEVLSGLAIAILIVYGGYQVIEGTRTAGALFSFMTAFFLAYEPMKKIAKMNASLQAGLAAAARIFQILDQPATLRDKPGATPLEVKEYSLHFRDVSFSYVGGAAALKRVSLNVPAGSTVALVGPSGAGKSTALNLIPRFYDVASGAIHVGGTDIRDVTIASLRAHIALVSQEVGLFNDTIRANISYGRWQAPTEEIYAAARAASAHDFIMALPQGYDTLVGEQGVKLSGGQRQRLSIARAMVRDAPILLLDEATSALDTESEKAVQEALSRLRKGRTTVIVAHRLSTIMDADRIYVFDQGVVVEEGTHRELLDRGGLYTRLYGAQRQAQEMARA